MTRVLRARAEAAIHSSLCLSGERKGVCGLSLGKQSGDSAVEGRLLGWASPSIHAVYLCMYVRGEKGTLVQAMTSGQPTPALSFHLPFVHPAQRGQAQDAHT